MSSKMKNCNSNLRSKHKARVWKCSQIQSTLQKTDMYCSRSNDLRTTMSEWVTKEVDSAMTMVVKSAINPWLIHITNVYSRHDQTFWRLAVYLAASTTQRTEQVIIQNNTPDVYSGSPPEWRFSYCRKTPGIENNNSSNVSTLFKISYDIIFTSFINSSYECLEIIYIFSISFPAISKRKG